MFNVAHNDREVRAKDLGASFVGMKFAYESPDGGRQVYGRIACIEVEAGRIHLTPEGNAKLGGNPSGMAMSSLILSFDESIYLPPQD